LKKNKWIIILQRTIQFIEKIDLKEKEEEEMVAHICTT